MAYRVLLVDDEPWALRDMEMTFPWGKYGFSVASRCSKAEEARKVMLSLRPDVVVTDLRMPGLSGVELLRCARQEGLQAIFVLVSGVSDFEAARQAIRYGAVEYCMKPLEEEGCEALVQRIAGMLHETAEPDSTSAEMRAVRDYIDANLYRKLTMTSVAAVFHMSANTLGRMFRSEMDTTFGQYLETRRMLMATRMLKDKRMSIGEIAERLGYSDQNYFTVCFKRRFSATPMQYRNHESGECE
ncbi:MAG: helix-turn-helix domain-containing protein [Eubacteriales bacterium]|nr:helix-turn-helix domain-containing protein [Eubacteriales bacterium]